MHLLPALPAVLLALVFAWLVWPLLADPVARALSGADADADEDDALRAWADLARTGRG